MAAQQLLQVVMLLMQSVAADMRNSQRYLEPTQMGSLMKIAMGPCTMTDLARHKAVSLPTVSKSVEKLVRRGWVERWMDKQDRRQTLVRLTAAGRRALAGIKKQAQQHVSEKLAPLGADERRELMAVLTRLTAVLAQSDTRSHDR
jgi:DNA-binding MarR family transcriptional regulator